MKICQRVSELLSGQDFVTQTDRQTPGEGNNVSPTSLIEGDNNLYKSGRSRESFVNFFPYAPQERWKLMILHN